MFRMINDRKPLEFSKWIKCLIFQTQFAVSQFQTKVNRFEKNGAWLQKWFCFTYEKCFLRLWKVLLRVGAIRFWNKMAKAPAPVVYWPRWAKSRLQLPKSGGRDRSMCSTYIFMWKEPQWEATVCWCLRDRLRSFYFEVFSFKVEHASKRRVIA